MCGETEHHVGCDRSKGVRGLSGTHPFQDNRLEIACTTQIY